ncbi:hypothetical protein P3X46_015114 [Hevea brasiliensis]|uniref:Late embryogenesis abundant 3-4 n=1 Tax=Hevea brasiliensis TaxID=3981 RepID=A0A3S5X999_HEVBR|nr:indole-3-acetic acid-induced protein ARG2 [Hevea brasiliensis]ALM01456.1 late embryogenesis abundant 3-4 [Hevea brasiliensis]KAJ9171800.1 hypothetical protein P3X46_015114 [Hevea brasiliensis]
MARSFSNAKVLSALITKAINRRGFSAAAAAPQGVVSSLPKGGASMVKKTAAENIASAEKVSWVPDPRTGFYRPENVAEEIDVAELRALLLKKH